MSVTITNKKICDFYKKYPDINLENLLCNFIDLIEKFAGNYSNVSEERIIDSVSSIKNLMGDINNSNLDNFKSILKLNSYENKDDINKVLSTITNKNSELFSKSKEETSKIISEHFLRHSELNSKDNEIAFEKMKNVFPSELIESMRDYFIKNKTSSFKGQQSENRLETLLNNTFQEAEITNMSKINHSGDFHLKRVDKDMIMIENKDYKANVGFESVTKFQNDCVELNSHGIFLSQNAGIVSKRDYSIEIVDNKVLIYLINVNYDSAKILTAVSLIDNLSHNLKTLCDTNKNNAITIDQNTMLEINEEISKFIQKKEKLYNQFKINEKTMKELLDELTLPKLNKFFAGKCSTIPLYKCDICGMVWEKKASLGNHMKAHKEAAKKKKISKKDSNIAMSINTGEQCMEIDTDEDN
tara:strand:- start:163 stop:1404 length:1242 start_codon:yes stop_codon:yes gene_type:complete